jgi:hypothetical protein
MCAVKSSSRLPNNRFSLPGTLDIMWRHPQRRTKNPRINSGRFGSVDATGNSDPVLCVLLHRICKTPCYGCACELQLIQNSFSESLHSLRTDFLFQFSCQGHIFRIFIVTLYMFQPNWLSSIVQVVCLRKSLFCFAITTAAAPFQAMNVLFWAMICWILYLSCSVALSYYGSSICKHRSEPQLHTKGKSETRSQMYTVLQKTAIILWTVVKQKAHIDTYTVKGNFYTMQI